MPKYLIQASYTVDGVQGLLKDGGSKRLRREPEGRSYSQGEQGERDEQ